MSSHIIDFAIDFEQFVRYSKPGPRYTSYPTAVEFKAFSQQDYLKALQSQDSKRDLSLYFHLPFCKSPCYFCGCSMIITSNSDKKNRYIEAIKKEIDLVAKHIDTTRVVSQLHLGGGTPTYFSAKNLGDLIDHVKATFSHFDQQAEISCEVDPRHFNEEKMALLASRGFNRISFGVQDFDAVVQKSVNRLQSFEMVQKVVKVSRAYGMQSINIDLIYGLPLQQTSGFKSTIEKTLQLDPDRLAIFNYAHVPWIKKIMNQIDDNDLPTAQEKLKILKMVIDTLSDNGYQMVGMDHFAKPTDELFLAIEKNQLHRNFQGYTTKGGSDLIGFGMTSIGYGVDYYAQNEKELSHYEQAINEGKIPIAKGIWLSDDDKLRQYIILSLMSNFQLPIKEVEQRFAINFHSYFAKEIERLAQFVDEGLLSISKQYIKVLNQTGIMLIRNIAMVFDAYLAKMATTQQTFSKTI